MRFYKLAVLGLILFKLDVLGLGIEKFVLSAFLVDLDRLFDFDVFLLVNGNQGVSFRLGDIVVNKL